MIRSRPRRRTGVTLIELVVATTIGGLVLGAGYSMLSNVIASREDAVAVARASTRAAAVRHDIITWTAGARLTIEEDEAVFRGLDGARKDVPDDDLTFLTTSRTPLGEAEAFVRLYIDRDVETAERGLVAAFSEPRGIRKSVVELEPRAAGLQLRYLSGVLGARQWLPSWISSSLLPIAVEITIVAAPAEALAPLLIAPMTVPLGSGR